MKRDGACDYVTITDRHLLAMTPEELDAVDPVAMNLLVAKGIDQLSDLDIAKYQQIVDRWTDDFRSRCLPYWEQFFHESPDDFRNDLRFFRLGMICQYIDLELGIAYQPEHRELVSVLYTNPSELFLNGLIDTKYGTCGNMAALHVAIGWRLDWPVSLACVNSHFICRYDDGDVVYNVESTDTGRGGWSCRTDEEFLRDVHIPPKAIRVGSDLRSLTSREMLGAFVALKARHQQDIGKAQRDEVVMLASEEDWLLSRFLFPKQRLTYKNQLAISAMRGEQLFSSAESGHPISFAQFLTDMYSPLRNADALATSEFDDVFSTVSKDLPW